MNQKTIVSNCEEHVSIEFVNQLNHHKFYLIHQHLNFYNIYILSLLNHECSLFTNEHLLWQENQLHDLYQVIWYKEGIDHLYIIKISFTHEFQISF